MSDLTDNLADIVSISATNVGDVGGSKPGDNPPLDNSTDPSVFDLTITGSDFLNPTQVFDGYCIQPWLRFRQNSDNTKMYYTTEKFGENPDGTEIGIVTFGDLNQDGTVDTTDDETNPDRLVITSELLAPSVWFLNNLKWEQKDADPELEGVLYADDGSTILNPTDDGTVTGNPIYLDYFDVQAAIWSTIFKDSNSSTGKGIYAPDYPDPLNPTFDTTPYGNSAFLAEEDGGGRDATDLNSELVATIEANGAGYQPTVAGDKAGILLLPDNNGQFILSTVELLNPPPIQDLGISLIKQVINPPTATDPEGNPVYSVGDPVTFAYTVSNTGRADLENITLIDDNATPDDPTDDIELKWNGTQVLVSIGGNNGLPTGWSVNFSSNSNTDNILNESEEWTFQVTKPAQFEDSLEKVCETEPCEFLVFDSFSGSDIEVTVTLEEVLDDPTTTDIDESGVRVSLQVSDPDLIGDLRGVFFDVADNNVMAIMDIIGNDVESYLIAADDVDRLEKDVLMKGGGTQPFDVGVQIGTQGMSTDDIQSTSFDVLGLSIEDLELQRFGIRLTSVGEDGGSREDSSKIIGYAPECGTTCNQLQTNLAGVEGFSASGEPVSDGFSDDGALADLGTNSQTIMVMG